MDVCTTVPDPPPATGLERKDSSTQFRVGDKAYFSCTDPEQIVEGTTGMNIFELPCQAGGTFDAAL